jgi:hypothetical protein
MSTATWWLREIASLGLLLCCTSAARESEPGTWSAFVAILLGIGAMHVHPSVGDLPALKEPSA